jgi:hypothetical protein
MSFMRNLRVVMVCVALQIGVVSGVPMLPDEIRELMDQMNRPKVAAALPAADAPGDNTAGDTVSGEWEVTVTFDAASVRKGAEARIDLVCAFEQRNTALAGSCRPRTGPDGVQLAGVADQSRVEWTFAIATSSSSRKETARFIGTVDARGEGMKGTVAIGEWKGVFEAHRY